MSERVVFYSGGLASWATAMRVIEQHGRENLTLLFTDPKMEDEDLYRFLDDTETQLGVPITRITEGRDPWQVFHDVRFLGNSRADPCSRVLKREPAHKWVEEHCDHETTTLYIGIDWTEIHRMKAIRAAWCPYTAEAPMMDRPFITKQGMSEWLQRCGVEPPRLYAMGYPHNNCGGFCIKAGHAQFRLLLRTNPDRYAYHERKEQEIRDHLDADVSVLKDRTGGEATPLTLKAFRERLEAGGQCDLFDWGGCGCFSE